MQPSSMSDTSSLADSAYEIIHGADSESPDDRLTESTCSLTAPATDDVHSLDGSEDPFRSDSEQESDHESHASSIRYADQALQNPSTQNPTSNLDYGSSTEGSGVVVRSIEFQEPDSGIPVLLETISAKHAVREFSEEESAALAHDLNLPNAPKRLVASIRQTMSQSYLSTEEPLRVLYVGRADAQRSIVLKICSAIWASPKNGSNDQDYFSRHRDGVYNIVPISSFGPAPELDLMEASHYQIKVEHCTTAQEVVYGEGDPTADQALYVITVDQEKSYRFDCSQSGSVVEPRWDLPHIAVFYCSELDDTEAERTRDAAWSFMRRHGLPSLFIADQQHFRNPTWGKYIDEHTVHLCLESRDPERPMEPRRFPIDYASFADIDARQMNRNLAYLTGLSAPDDTELEPEVRAVLETPKHACTPFADHQNLKRWIFAVVPMVVALIAPYLVLPLIGLLRPGDVSHIQPASSTGVCVSPLSGLTTSKASSVATSTKTVVINVTSTKTVQVSRTKPSTSTLASALSLAGFLSDRPSAVPADTEVKTPANSGNTVCSVRVYSPTEFLVAIPSQNKAVWLARGAIDIVVRRSDDAVKTKFSSVDEGVLVELDPKDAYGVLNVSVATTRRPKINETFQIDFGKSTLTEAFEAGLQILQSALGKVWRPDEAHQLFEDARRLPLDAVSALEHASGAVRNHTAETIEWLTGEFHAELTAQRKLAKALGVELRLGVIQAQIASRLWWLKMRGKEDQYAEYERNGSRFLKKMHEELRGGQEGKENDTPKKTKSYFDFRSMTSRSWSCKKACASRDEGTNDSASHGGALKKTWKKLVKGV
ncbi:hypothetical protein NEMBOFW57_000765 [Staphylotrichum longicolle]|uniref:Uncharacterized protein n=1 Tax=Staphylotrichum longicolle TaxID=669026 RepID=A0AAD4I073_9PEZI|nr:hypothetical protein NEMBOFW57_000765 [Staphylotrichum longicolle]